MNILDLKSNQTAEISLVRNKKNPAVRIAEAMGLRKGERVQLSTRNGRNLIVKIGGGKIVIDQEVAKEIEII